MKVSYEFIFQDGRKKSLDVDPDTQASAPEEEREWTRLEHCQCSNCPLSRDEHPHCPAALKMIPVVDAFHDEKAFQKLTVRVHTEGRIYEKETRLEEGLRSLLGLVMATSACPHLVKLRPMAVHHMPFASNDEFIARSVSLYLLEQLFNRQDGLQADWDLEGLVERNQNLRLVNQALWQRIHDVCEEDGNLKALLSFFSMASSVSGSLEAQLRQIRKKFDADRTGPSVSE